MPTCIYCLEEKDESAFTSREHVLQDAFGRFNSAPTLSDPVVCDDCNAKFGRTIDLYLARDTPIGLARFVFGLKPPEEYKSLGRRSTMRTQHTEGRLAGATLFINPSANPNGLLETKCPPQIGVGKTIDGPFKFFLCEDLPSAKDEIRALIDSGHRSVEFVEVVDVPQMVETLRDLGLPIGDIRETEPVGNRGVQRFESAAVLTQTFGRAIAKIGMNYLASQHGPTVARMAAFDAIRKYVRYAEPMPRGTWWSAPMTVRDRRFHRLAVFWDHPRRRVVAEVCFFGMYRYQVVLSATGGFLTHPPFAPRGHRYDLTTMTVEALPQSGLLTLA